jgi:hypothetical protein
MISGAVLWRGASVLDGSPIVAIITGLASASSNSKTGDMPQVWILRADKHPQDALRDGSDSAICGACPHRPQVLGVDALKKSSRSCYVNVMSFNGIWKKFLAGGYPDISPSDLGAMLTGKKVRLGAYGDPAAVPLEVWRDLCSTCESTGYTHQWKTCEPGYQEFCMASCDSPADVISATAQGWRCFFVQRGEALVRQLEVVQGVRYLKLASCPASKESGRVTTCSECMACSGTRSGRKSNIAIMMH